MSKHLSKSQRIELGSFYTPKKYVDIAYSMLSEDELNNYQIIDPAAGYGDFIKDNKNFVGFDIDKKAVEIAKKEFTNAKIKHRNTLSSSLKLNKNNIFIGNPPYNNLSSLYKKGKKGEFEVLPQFKSRDLGISFMKMMASYNPKRIVILHPLAFLIKESNYKLLGDFFKKYRLDNAYILNSSVFEGASKVTPFPIVIASYSNSQNKQTFEEILSVPMRTDDDGEVIFSELSVIDKDFVNKYPKRNDPKTKNMFYTMRDNNALSRNATWLKKENSGTIFVKDKNVWKYNYIHLYKQWFKANQDRAWIIGNCQPLLISDYKKYKNRLSKMNISEQTKKMIFKSLTKEFEKWRQKLQSKQNL